MQSFGWRIPFWASAVLVFIGLYVRRRLQETPLFKLAQERDNTTRSPLREVFKSNWKEILKGTFLMGATYAMFFTLTTWSLSYATTALGFSHSEFLLLLMGAIVEFAVLIMATSVLADKIGRKKVLMTASVLLVVFSLVFPFFLEGKHNMVGMLLFLGVGFVIMGTLYGPVGAVLPELFPTKVRYSGAGITYSRCRCRRCSDDHDMADRAIRFAFCRSVHVCVGTRFRCCMGIDSGNEGRRLYEIEVKKFF